MIKRLNVKIKRTIFGRRAKGNPIPPLHIHTTQVDQSSGFFEWCKEMQVSSKYQIDKPSFY
jgi:hypothetical protein